MDTTSKKAPVKLCNIPATKPITIATFKVLPALLVATITNGVDRSISNANTRI
jgi:hypothetical protein